MRQSKVRFVDAKGEEVLFLDPLASTFELPVDTEVEVLYPPEDPEDATIDEPRRVWFLPRVFGVLGRGFTVVSACVLTVGIAML